MVWIIVNFSSKYKRLSIESNELFCWLFIWNQAFYCRKSIVSNFPAQRLNYPAQNLMCIILLLESACYLQDKSICVRFFCLSFCFAMVCRKNKKNAWLCGRIVVYYISKLPGTGNHMESWLSGRRRTTGNRVCVMSVPRVQIPDSPP